MTQVSTFLSTYFSKYKGRITHPKTHTLHILQLQMRTFYGLKLDWKTRNISHSAWTKIQLIVVSCHFHIHSSRQRSADSQIWCYGWNGQISTLIFIHKGIILLIVCSHDNSVCFLSDIHFWLLSHENRTPLCIFSSVDHKLYQSKQRHWPWWKEHKSNCT